MKKAKVVIPFLPPPSEDEDSIIATYPKKIFSIIRNKYLIVFSAYKINFYRQTDTYGLDLILQALPKIIEINRNVLLIIAIADFSNGKKYFENLISENNLKQFADHFFLLTDQKEIWPLIKRAQLFIRPTCTDGDAVSIREALYFGTPVIASDVVTRPQGTILFKNRDFNDFVEIIIKQLEKC